MVYTLFVVEIIFAFILAATLLYRYGDCYRNHIIVTVSVLTAWYFSFVIMFVLPLDVSSTVYRQCKLENTTNPVTAGPVSVSGIGNESTTVPTPASQCQEPWSFVPDDVFRNLWRVLYWTSQCLTWLIMPMMQSYSKAGDFTVKGKLKSALVDNAIYYGSYLFICGILLIYLALQPGTSLDGPKIKAIASSASNTWGLFLLILLLGYALVEVPRNLWNNSKKNYTLTYSYFKIAKLSTDKCEAEESVDDILDSLNSVCAAVGPGHPLQRHVETIIQKLPIQLRDRLNSRAPPERPAPPSFKSLVNLHKKTIKSLHVLQRTETQWGLMLERIFHLEDVAANLRSPDKRFQHTFHTPRPRLQRILYPPPIEWWWECFLRQYFLKTMAVITGILSVAVVWSEMTFFCKKPVLSIFANIIIAAGSNYNYAAIVTISTLIIAYMFYCAYSTLLKIRVLNLYYLAAHHQTNEYSLIFSGMMVSRLTPAMCLNFLSLVHMDSHVIKERVQETFYTQVMGHMDVLGIIAEGFNIYFPMLVVLLCAATYLSLGSRLLSMCGFHQFVGDDELTTDLVDEGREIVKREKRKRQRAEETMTRRRDFSERYSTYRTGRENQDGDYYVQPSPERSQPISGYQRAEVPYNRTNLTLEDELDQRFGDSTLPSIRTEFDGRRDKLTMPPKGLFDDV
ncbi:LMBR1 domain-containing protein 2 homolog isoform X2 [Pectinophora gossypiella]|uniref:LMBR1 domain-containing protein 2 homolog n=1 Tax=Pectinophora gossypiella TaxID=13191 RepID=A0A1E1WQ97_PECGO|nr:LMBR1 domain-containing protein 2 homolog isoform X2 [Pectinophora gossypiella]